MKKRLNFRSRSLSLFLVFLLLLSLLTGCNPGNSNVAESSSDETTEVPETDPVFLSLIENGSTPYTILCSDDASDTVKDKTLEFYATLTELTEVQFGVGTDFYNPYKETLPERAYEILIGETNRPESIEAQAMIRGRDFIIMEKNDRIVILGGNEQKTLEALEYFLSNYLTSDQNIVIQQGGRYISRFAYDIGVITIDGVNLMEYTVVVPKEPETLFPYYAALNLIDLLETEAGISLPLVYDDTEPTEYEIVIGETNRAESLSASKVSLKNNQYILKKVGSSIYMYGEDYMVGGAVSEFINAYILEENATEIEVVGLPSSNITKSFTFPETATSAILLIGDGMGEQHISYTYSKRDDTFLATYLDNIGKSTTYPYGGSATSTGYTDSAASATALATGYKTRNSYLGVDQNNRTLLNVRELASSLGAKTAVLTSDVITGATPAGFLCHHNSRSATSTLQSQINQLRRTDKNLLFATSVDSNKNELLPETRNILYTLADEGETYFAMIEEAYIDKRSHKNDLSGMKICVLRYNDIIGYCVQFVMLHPETALVITADHECGGLIFNSDGTFSYTSDDHTNAKVPVYAIGPGTDCFDGVTVDNTDIGKFLGAIYTDDQFGDPSLD